MARAKRFPVADTPANAFPCHPIDLEEITRRAIFEHRKLAALADDAYAAWQKAGAVNGRDTAEMEYRYTQAMLTMRLQQEELNAMIDRLGYIPKNVR